MCDSHIIKMPLEYTQMLCTFLHETKGVAHTTNLYKPTHKNHPCNRWLRDTIYSLDWFIPHALATFNEFTFRREKPHASAIVFANAMLRIEGRTFQDYDPAKCLTLPPQCMPEECRVENDTVKAYRNYYLTKKTHLLKWTKRTQPTWITKHEHQQH